MLEVTARFLFAIPNVFPFAPKYTVVILYPEFIRNKLNNSTNALLFFKDLTEKGVFLTREEPLRRG